MTFTPKFVALVLTGLLSGCATQNADIQTVAVLAPISGQSVQAGVPCEQLAENLVNRVGGCEGFIPMPALSSEQAAEIVRLDTRFAAEVSPVVNFDFNRDVLTPRAVAIVDAQAAWMRRYPQIRFSVFGHTDLVGSEGYNFDLAKRRAETVVARLIGQGVGNDQLDALVSYGKTRPLIDTSGAEEINRRTLTQVTGYLDKPRLHATVAVNCGWFKPSYLPSYGNCVNEPSLPLPPPPPPSPPPTKTIDTYSYDTNQTRPATSTSAGSSDDGTTKTDYANSRSGSQSTSVQVTTTGDKRYVQVQDKNYVTDLDGSNPVEVHSEP